MAYERWCSSCRETKPLTPVFFKPKGQDFNVTCIRCSTERAARRKAKQANCENIPPGASHDTGDSNNDEPDDDPALFSALSVLTLPIFLASIASIPDINIFEAQVNLSVMGDILTEREKADTLAENVWDKLGYRFRCVCCNYQLSLN